MINPHACRQRTQTCRVTWGDNLAHMFRRTACWLLFTGSISALAAAAVTAIPGCTGLPGGRDEVRRLNVVVVTLDTLSARHLTQYGNDRIDTPAFGPGSGGGRPLRAGDCHRAAHPALPHLDVHRDLPDVQRSAGQRRLLRPGGFRDPRRSAERGGVPDRSVRCGLRRRLPLGSGSGLRPLPRRLQLPRVRAHQPRQRAAARRRGSRGGARLDGRGEGGTLLLLDPPLRPALALRGPGALGVPGQRLFGSALRRGGAVHRLPGRAVAGLAGRERTRGRHVARPDGGPRREPRPASGGGARFLHLRRGDAGALPPPGALPPDRPRTAGPGPGARNRPDAHRPRPGGGPGPGRRPGRKPRSARGRHGDRPGTLGVLGELLPPQPLRLVSAPRPPQRAAPLHLGAAPGTLRGARGSG